MKLALGTVQFGLPYGVANQRGQVSRAEVADILSVAREAGIDTIDTAIAYGESESCLGQAGVSDFNVVTKLPPVPAQCADVADWVRGQILASLDRLGIQCLRGLLLHQVGQLAGEHGAVLVEVLRALKSDGVVEKIGVSIYAPDDLEIAAAHRVIDLIQAPFNLFDRRLYNSGWLQRLSVQGVEVHVRSAFLQGLLLMPPASIPPKFSPWTNVLGAWHRWLSRHPHVSPTHACLAFVMNYPQIARIIVGVDSLAQLKQLLAVAALPLADLLPDLTCSDEMLINPSNWSYL